MPVKTRSANSMSLSNHLAQRQLGPHGFENGVFRLVGRSDVPTNPAEEAAFLNASGGPTILGFRFAFPAHSLKIGFKGTTER